MRNRIKSKFINSGFGINFDDSCSWNFGDGLAQNLADLVLAIVHQNIVEIVKIIFQYQMKDQLMKLMTVLVNRK